MCQLVKNKNQIYLSAHILGNAIDFNVSGYNTEDVYKAIQDNIDAFEYPIRIEINSTTWCHVDCYQPVGSEAPAEEQAGEHCVGPAGGRTVRDADPG